MDERMTAFLGLSVRERIRVAYEFAATIPHDEFGQRALDGVRRWLADPTDTSGITTRGAEWANRDSGIVVACAVAALLGLDFTAEYPQESRERAAAEWALRAVKEVVDQARMQAADAAMPAIQDKLASALVQPAPA